MQKYLQQYAEMQLEELADFPASGYKHCLVVPMFDEDEQFFVCNHKVLADNKVLCIVVINQSADAKPNQNAALSSWLEDKLTVNWKSNNGSLVRYKMAAQSDVLLVDCYTTGREIDAKNGVGLARKIGADIACQLIENKRIESPWIHNTDADVELPGNYFSATATQAGHAVILYPFRHTKPEDPALATAIDLYETHLHYYQRGLARAQSPYAFHTVGSTIAVDAAHYAKVRGFPKRAAGEDFYLLNKLRKTGTIFTLDDPAITIDTRLSQRTPFGTGSALADIIQLPQPERDYRFYHPEVFTRLKELLIATEQIAAKKTSFDASLNDPTLKTCLLNMGITKALAHCDQQSSDAEGFLKHFHAWFDAFRTLKLVHALRDTGYASVPLETIKSVAFMRDYFKKQGQP